MFTHALCRRPGPHLALGLTTADLSTAGLGAPDPAAALAQHAAYVEALRAAGLDVTVLEAEPAHPDAHFVEDTAVILPGLAVVCRPGHPDRRGEERSVEPVLARWLPLARIQAPATVDGGDVLQVGRHVFIGVSSRTNGEGARQLGEIVTRHGGTWTAVPLAAGLHLKSSVNEVGDALLLTAAFAGRPEFAGYPRLVVPPGEEYAANVLNLGGRLLVPAGFPATFQVLGRLGMPITTLDISEMRKMDGGLTCLSLRLAL